MNTWYFTFGMGQQYVSYYVKLKGTQEETRKKMFSMYGSTWSTQYSHKRWTMRTDRWDKNDKTMADVWGWEELKQE